MRSRLNWLNWLSIGLLSASVCLWVIAPGFAQEADDSEDALDAENTSCLSDDAEAGLILPMLELYNDMLSFLDEHYQSEEPATALLETATLKFEQFEADMEALISTYAVAQVNQPSDQESAENQKCIDLVRLKIKEVELLMRNHHFQNAGAKTAYTLVNKLKDINDGLRDMAKDFADIQTEFKTLDAKLTNTTE